MRNDLTNDEAVEAFEESFREAAGNDTPWMAAVWRVKDGKIELMQVTTRKFPVGDFCGAAGHLLLSLHDRGLELNRGPHLPSTPLPRAENLLGKDFLNIGVMGGMFQDEADEQGGGEE